MKRSAFLLLLAAAAAFAEPRLYLSANGVRTAKIWPGMPVLIEVSALGLAEGEPLPNSTLVIANTDDSSVTLASRRLDETRWVIEPDWTREVSPGRYEAKLTRASSPVTIVVAARPDEPSVDELWRETQWLAWYESRSGQIPSALNRVETWLKDHPEDARALAARAELLEHSDRIAEAVVAWSKAIEAEEKVRQSMGARREVPGALYLRRDALLRRFMQPQ